MNFKEIDRGLIRDLRKTSNRLPRCSERVKLRLAIDNLEKRLQVDWAKEVEEAERR